jgi:LPXTG-motif cell wall-anchored protein
VLRVLSTTFLCLPNDDCGTRGFLPRGNWILIVGGSLVVAGGAGFLLARRRREPDEQTDWLSLPEDKAVT